MIRTGFNALVLLFVFLNPCRSRQQPADTLAGAWGSEHDFGLEARGRLAIEGRGPVWRARIGKFDVPVRRDSGRIRFTLPHDQGEFRGAMSNDATLIEGNWIQPMSIIRFQRYATPVQLTHSEPENAWVGNVEPLENRIAFYLLMTRSANRGMKAVIRNPQYGWFGAREFDVTQKGDSITLSDSRGQIQGAYSATSDRLTLSLIGNDSTTVFSRTKAGAHAGFSNPFQGDLPAYTYHRPSSKNDGWNTATLTEAGLDEEEVARMIESFTAGDRSDPMFIPAHSILIARHGKLALEEYFDGSDGSVPHDTRSAGKTLAPVMVGVARENGAKVGPDTPVLGLFPEYRPLANWDDRKEKITLEEIMTMTSGLACDDNDASSPGNEGTMQQQTDKPDWYKYTLDLPVARDPGGSTAIYCSATINLVGGVAARASGEWLPDLFYRSFAKPLGFGPYHLNLTPTGDAYMGGGAYLLPRDELKLGQLYLSGGEWRGRRIVSKEWVEKSTTPHSRYAKPLVPIDSIHQYGYGWHIHDFNVGGRVYREYAAEGNGGQMVMVFPRLEMVVALNAGAYGNRNWYRWALELIPKYLIPSTEEK